MAKPASLVYNWIKECPIQSRSEIVLSAGTDLCRVNDLKLENEDTQTLGAVTVFVHPVKHGDL